MPLFAYQALDKAGATMAGKMEADHEWTAISRLRKMGYTVVEINEVRESSLRRALEIRRKVGMGDLALFSRQLAAMLNSGIPLTRSLFALSEKSVNPTLGRVAGEAARNVEGGMSFSESIRAYPEVFSSMYVDMIKSGEIGGTLESVLLRLADQLDRDKSLRDNVRSATMYPIAVVVFALCILMAMLLFIVPIFVQFFPEGVTLPLPTKMILALSDSLRGYWYIYLLVVVALLLGARTYIFSESGRMTWDRTKFSLPVFGPILQKTTVARFARTLSTLLGGGIPVLQALDAAGPASGSSLVTEAVNRAAERIQEGQSIAEPLKSSGLFPPMVTLMVAVGEETGELPSMLSSIAEFYEAEVATTTKGLTSLIEPLLIIIVGSLVGFMVISLYLPVFTVVTQMGR